MTLQAVQDLEQHFDDAHSIVVLCSRFEEHLRAYRHLLSRAREAGVRTLSSHTAILVLPRPGDAMQMTDNGVPVQSVEEGYDVKERSPLDAAWSGSFESARTVLQRR